MEVAGLYLHETFSMDGQLFGILCSHSDPSFKQFVSVSLKQEVPSWKSLPEETEPLVRRTYYRIHSKG